MTVISIDYQKEKSFPLSKIPVLLLMMFFLIATTYAISYYYNPNDNRNKTENTENSGNGSSNNSKKIKLDENKSMHQLGKHFNKHGRGMGYQSKAEYNRAALEFAKTNRTNSNAKIYEGIWRARGDMARDVKQVVISYKNRTVIIDKLSGQLVNFYDGVELRGLINLTAL